MGQNVEWLNDVETRAWRGFIQASGRVVQLLDASLKANAGMTFDDYEVLVHLSEAEGSRMRMTELSDRLLQSQSRLSQRVDRLVKRGWVYREKSKEDRRGTYAVLAPEGLRAIEEAAPRHVTDVRRVFLDHISAAELEVGGELFERIAVAARDRGLQTDL